MSSASWDAPATILFPPFALDLRAGQLRRDASPVPLRPKTFAVLRHLIERPGELVSKSDLLDAVWGDVAVSEDVVRLSVGELRVALGDERAAPRFIETVPRRGYRFIAVTGAALPVAATQDAPALDDRGVASPATLVGRVRERATIAEWLQAAAGGWRQVGFISGDAGIGKTTLIDSVLDDLARAAIPPLRIARGHCVEHFGSGEPYLPVLEAMAMLRRGPGSAAVDAALSDCGPDWLLRSLGLPRVERGEPPVGTHEHALHKLAAAFDALAAERLTVVVFEDVQWIDYSTLDLLSVLARRRDPARLLVLCTLRPVDAIVSGHPVAGVKRELVRSGLCTELLLAGLAAADVAAYLAKRFPGARLPDDLLPLLVDRSDGNPFFMIALLDDLIARRLLVESAGRWELRGAFESLRATIPDDLRAVIEPRLERLAVEERSVIEAASVVGVEFAAHAVSRCAPEGSNLADVEHVERLCDGLARRQEILRGAGDGTWPDGSISACYAFRHALYHQVVYERLSPSARRRLHQATGEALEAAHVGRTSEIAAELAAHFEQSRDVARAVRYHAEAAAHARSRFSYAGALSHLERALEGIRAQPDTADRSRLEMNLLEDLGWTLFALRGFGDEGAARAFTRVRKLAERLDAPAVKMRAMDSLLTVHTMRAEYGKARALGDEMLWLAERLGDPTAATNVRPTLGAVLIHLGEVEAAHDHALSGRATMGPESISIQGISSCLLLSSTSAHLGQIALARAASREAVELAVTLGIPYLRAHATTFATTVSQVMRDVNATRVLALETQRLATECGFSVFRSLAMMYLGWCDVREGRMGDGLAALREGFAQYASSGQRISTTSYALLLAEAYLVSGDADRANAVVDDALAFGAETGERINQHEAYRLKGECLLARGASGERVAAAAECFERAMAIAAGQRALLFELRAAVSLYRVRSSARPRLAELAARFARADDCADLRAAQSALAEAAEVRSAL